MYLNILVDHFCLLNVEKHAHTQTFRLIWPWFLSPRSWGTWWTHPDGTTPRVDCLRWSLCQPCWASNPGNISSLWSTGALTSRRSESALGMFQSSLRNETSRFNATLRNNHKHIYIYIWVHFYTGVHICTYVCVYMYMCVCKYACDVPQCTVVGSKSKVVPM